MKLPALSLCLALFSCASVQTDEGQILPESPDPITVTDLSREAIALQVGYRTFGDDDLFGPVDSGGVVGLEYSRVRDDGLGFEAGLLGSLEVDNGQDDPNVIGVGAELYGGIRKDFQYGHVRPYAGAGATLIYADVNDDSGAQVPDDRDTSLGFYLHGGVLYPWTEQTSIGLDLRYVGGTSVDFGPFSGDANYLQAMLVVSFGL